MPHKGAVAAKRFKDTARWLEVRNDVAYGKIGRIDAVAFQGPHALKSFSPSPAILRQSAASFCNTSTMKPSADLDSFSARSASFLAEPSALKRFPTLRSHGNSRPMNSLVMTY